MLRVTEIHIRRPSVYGEQAGQSGRSFAETSIALRVHGDGDEVVRLFNGVNTGQLADDLNKAITKVLVDSSRAVLADQPPEVLTKLEGP